MLVDNNPPSSRFIRAFTAITYVGVVTATT